MLMCGVEIGACTVTGTKVGGAAGGGANLASVGFGDAVAGDERPHGAPQP